MKYPNITIQYDDFDERYEVVEALESYLYKEIATFKSKADAAPFAQTKAAAKGLEVVDKCSKKRKRAAQGKDGKHD